MKALDPKANAISPEKPAKERLAVGARVRVLIENEGKEGLYFDDDRVAWLASSMSRVSQFEASDFAQCAVSFFLLVS